VKKAERILGIIAIVSFALAILFKNMAWPGGNVLLNLTLVSFNFGYLPINLILQYRKASSTLYKAYLIIKFITFFTIIWGFVFKLMHWPGADVILIFINYALPFFILFYFYVRFRNKGALPFNLQDLVIAVLGYGIYFYVVRVLITPSVIEGYVIIDEQFTALNTGIESSNELIYSSLGAASSDNNQHLLESIQQLKSESNTVRLVIDSVRDEFMKYSTNVHYSGDKELSYFGTRLLADVSKGTDFFVNLENGDRIESFIDHYVDEVDSIARKHHLKSSLIGSGLETEGYEDEWGYQYSWSELKFGYLPLAAVFSNLSWIKQMTLLTESTVLTGLIYRIDFSKEALLLQEFASRESDRAISQKEDEILRIRQQQELQQFQLEKSQSDLRDRNIIILIALIGIAFVLILFIISTRAYVLKQKDNKKLAEQKDQITEKNEALNQQNEEISAQRDEIEAQRDEIEAQRDLVFQQKEQIEKTHQEISASIDYATRLQSSILTNTDLLKEYFSDHYIFFRPRDKVSGDFYWWSMVEKHLIIAVADCTGHGVPGAFMSMLGISLLREIVNKGFITKPGAILEHLRTEVIRSLNQKGEKGEQKDGLDISLLSINTDTWKCQYAGAHNPIYLIRNKNLTEFKPDMMPISIYERMDKFAVHELQLETGDQIYLFSDGFADQFGGKHRKKFKYKAFKQLLLDNSSESLDKQHQALLDTIMEWTGDYEQIDDMVVVGLKVGLITV